MDVRGHCSLRVPIQYSKRQVDAKYSLAFLVPGTTTASRSSKSPWSPFQTEQHAVAHRAADLQQLRVHVEVHRKKVQLQKVQPEVQPEQQSSTTTAATTTTTESDEATSAATTSASQATESGQAAEAAAGTDQPKEAATAARGQARSESG